jgi:hypothetical protein
MTVVTQPGYSSSDLLATGPVSFVGSLISNNNWCDLNHGAVYVPVYRGAGYAGWGSPPPGCGGRNGWASGNNVNVSGNTINVNNAQRWSPNNNRRPANATTRVQAAGPSQMM